DDLLTLDVRDVEALDADRQRFEIERLPELFERLDTPRPLALGDERLGFERQLGVLLRELLQAPLLAALRDTHLDPGAAALREERRERRGVARAARHENLRRDGRRAPVILEAELLDHLAGLLAGRVLEMKRVAVDHPPFPQR